MGSATPETVGKAIDALLKWRKSQSQTQKAKLFDQDEEFVYLIITLKKVPQKGRVNPHKIPLPHSLLSQFSELCLFIDDRSKSQLTKSDAQKKIQSENIPISKVLKLSKLASDYRPFEAKRKLCNSYDMFFCDKRVVPPLPRLLGKQFFRKKVAVPLDLTKKNWKEQVERACSSALLVLRTGTCSVVKVAKVSMDRDEIVDNVVAAINGIVEVVPKKWANVRSFHVKLLESLALPVYQAAPDMKLKIEGVKGEGEVGVVVQKKKKKNEEEKEEGAEIHDRKVGKKKGRIHEVRYMDDNVGEDFVDDESGSEDEDNDDGDALVEDDSEKGSGELVNKKRKQGSKLGKGALTELNGVKQSKKLAKESGKQKTKKKDGLSARVVKENLVKESKGHKLSTENEGLGKKKMKKSEVQSKGADMKVKVKKRKEKRDWSCSIFC